MFTSLLPITCVCLQLDFPLLVFVYSSLPAIFVCLSLSHSPHITAVCLNLTPSQFVYNHKKLFCATKFLAGKGVWLQEPCHATVFCGDGDNTPTLCKHYTTRAHTRTHKHILDMPINKNIYRVYRFINGSRVLPLPVYAYDLSIYLSNAFFSPLLCPSQMIPRQAEGCLWYADFDGHTHASLPPSLSPGTCHTW